MFNDQQYVIPHIRTFKIESLPQIKLPTSNGKSKLINNRIFMPIETNLLSTKINENNKEAISNFEQVVQSSNKHKFITKQTTKFPSQQQIQSPVNTELQDVSYPIINVPSTSQKTLLNKHIIPESNLLSSSDTQQSMDEIPTEVTFNYGSVLIQEQHASIAPINAHQLSSSQIPNEHFFLHTNKTDALSSVIQLERPLLSSPLSQLIPDSIINDKQATKRIFNENNSTHFLHPSQLVTLTPINSSSKKTSQLINNDDNKSSSNHVQYYQIGSIFTSTSTFLMHQNEVIAHATASNPFLSDTIFIIIIATLTIIILLFCLGLFCLCRRTTKRTISPSFDGGTYTGLHGQSFTIPIDNYQQGISKYENDISSSSSIQVKSPINHRSLMNDRILLPQTVALHHTAKQKVQMSKKKLKKKRAGFCCCNSNQTSSTIVNARTRIQRNEI